MPAPAALVERVRLALTLPNRSPLDYFKFSVDRLREGLRMFVSDDPIDELACRAGNKGAKTYNLAAYVLACLQKRSELDGVRLPQWQGPVTALCLVLDHEQQKLSTQKHIVRLLGGWPAKITNKGQGIIGEIKIMPIDGSDDVSTWSTLTIMTQKNPQSGVGARADIVWPDEPPNEMIWREVRKAADAGRRIIRPMGFTPTIRRQWAWLREEYGDSPRDRITRITQDWAECRWSVFDNKALTKEEVAKLLREYKKDGLRDARIYGDYSNEVGACPFDVETLTAMLAECVEPRMVKCRITQEAAEDGRARETGFALVELYATARTGMNYYIPIDPSSGTDKSGYDPAGLDVYEMGTGDLVASYGGYIAPYSLGTLAAGLARQYNNAKVDVEVNDGWGINVLNGLRDSKYGNIAHELRELTPGVWAKELGFRTTRASRAAMVGAIQAQIEAWRGGIRYGKCPSRKHIECLLDCVVDETGKPVAAPGMHDERMITRGQGLRRAVTRSGMAIPEVYAPRRADAGDAELMALIAGERDDDDAPFGQVATRPRARPRM